MKYEVVVTRQFRKDYKLAIKRGYAQEKLEHVIELLSWRALAGTLS